MKRKYYMRGLGVGIIIATLIFIPLYAVEKNNKMTNAEIEEAAEELGMSYPESSGTIQDSIDEEESESETEEESESENATTTVEDETETTTTISDDETGTTTTTVEDETGTTTTTVIGNDSLGETVTITVDSGDTSTVVAQKLEDAGVIDDAGDFDDYLNAYGYDSKLQTGEISIVNGTSFEEIAQALTSR